MPAVETVESRAVETFLYDTGEAVAEKRKPSRQERKMKRCMLTDFLIASRKES